MVDITIDAILENLDDVQAMIEEQSETIDAPMKSVIQLQLAVEEAFVNIARYAYAPSVGKVRISCGCDADTGEMTVTFCDEGVAFNPLSRDEPDLTSSAEERPIGGLGIHLIKKNTDSVEYSRDGDRNVLKLIKKMR